MNMTYAKSRFRLPPSERKGNYRWAGPRGEVFVPYRWALGRKIVVAKSALTVPSPSSGRGRARRHRLNPGRRTVEQNRAAR